MLADELECALRTNILNPLREVRAEKQEEVDICRFGELESSTNVGPINEDQWIVSIGNISNEGSLVDKDVLGKE
jgi:hypothetical protein